MPIPPAPSRHPFEPDMVHIPAGPFTMGTNQAQIDELAEISVVARKWRKRGFFDRELPEHTLTLPDFHLARTPVTVGQFRTFILEGGYQSPEYWTGSGWQWRLAGEHTQPDLWDEPHWTCEDSLPVVGVTWYEAFAYCHWLWKRTGKPYRLPTEAEWEKAARGSDARLYPWGEQFDESLCNTRAAGLQRTIPVGTFSPAGDSPYGCADMVGNVSEWVLSHFHPYPYNPDDGRDYPDGDSERTTRGGSWHSPQLRARPVSRGYNHPFFRDNDLGFRPACDFKLLHY